MPEDWLLAEVDVAVAVAVETDGGVGELSTGTVLGALLAANLFCAC